MRWNAPLSGQTGLDSWDIFLFACSFRSINHKTLLGALAVDASLSFFFILFYFFSESLHTCQLKTYINNWNPKSNGLFKVRSLLSKLDLWILNLANQPKVKANQPSFPYKLMKILRMVTPFAGAHMFCASREGPRHPDFLRMALFQMNFRAVYDRKRISW